MQNVTAKGASKPGVATVAGEAEKTKRHGTAMEDPAGASIAHCTSRRILESAGIQDRAERPAAEHPLLLAEWRAHGFCLLGGVWRATLSHVKVRLTETDRDRDREGQGERQGEGQGPKQKQVRQDKPLMRKLKSLNCFARRENELNQ